MPDWFKLIKKGVELVQKARSAPVEAVVPRCVIDHLPMHQIGSDPPAYQCPYGHIFVPGVDVGDKDGILARSRGDFRGQI